MKILHLFSRWKWTGPADPTWNLCKGLEKQGHEVTFAYRRPPFPIEGCVEKRVFQPGVKATDRFQRNHSIKVYQKSHGETTF